MVLCYAAHCIDVFLGFPIQALGQAHQALVIKAAWAQLKGSPHNSLGTACPLVHTGTASLQETCQKQADQ